MSTPEEMASIIRFALSQLSARNGHHEFEELVRHLARSRIATNIIPATGPVAAGGDQGRDLESFRTYLAREIGPHGAFLARASEETLAFTCTLQSERLTSKIKGDVGKIVASGSAVDRVYAFVTGDLPVGQRHKVQTEVREEYGLELEVFDARAIAQELADPETFWIAARYLSLPAEIAPPPSNLADVPEWYTEVRATWRERYPANTLADLLSVKRGLRQATFDKAARPDLPFWLDLMRHFIDASFAEDLQRRARYEVSVATLRGIGDLKPADGLAAEFIEESCQGEDIFHLEDGTVLLMYCVGAVMRAKTRLSVEQLVEWNSRLCQRIEDMLSGAPGPNRRALLLNLLGFLKMQPDPRRRTVVDEPMPDVAEMLNEEGDFDVDITAVSDLVPERVMVDVDAGMRALTEMTTLFDQAQLFPIERFAKYISFVTPLIVDHPLYRELADAIDAKIEKTSGRAAAAARCRDRAVALRRANKCVAALRELHQTKVGWWSGDSLRGSLLAMFLIADCYEQLAFLHAAKHWLLLAAWIAADSKDDDLQDLFAQGVCVAAHMDYSLGNWAMSAATAESGLKLHSNVVSALDLDDERIKRMMFELLWIYIAGRDIVPDSAPRSGICLNERACGRSWRRWQRAWIHDQPRSGSTSSARSSTASGWAT